MRTLKGRKFRSDIDVEYCKKYNIKFSGTKEEYDWSKPIFTEERMKEAIKFVEWVLKDKDTNHTS